MNGIVMVLISRLISSCLCVFEYEYDLQHINHDISLFNIPERFDARRQWANCTYAINRIYNCKSCSEWAFIAASVMTDRLCIVSGGTFREHVSVEDLLECAHTRLGHTIGCDAAFRYHQIFNYWKQNGVVTERCKPLSFRSVRGRPDTVCQYSCSGDPRFNYRQEKTFGMASLRYFEGDPRQIQVEIMQNGPVLTIVRQSKSLKNAKRGVLVKYRKDDSTSQDNWCYLKLIGWDVIEGIPAWIAAGAHSSNWADNGFALIKIGDKRFETEQNVFTGLPDPPCSDNRNKLPPPFPRLEKRSNGSTINELAIILLISVFIMVLI